MSNELHFDADSARDPSVTQTRTAIDILTENPYCFMSNAYYGSGGFRTGQYLVPHTREMFYNRRRQISYYKNFTKPVLRAMIDPVFNEPVSRDITGNTEAFDAFLMDVDLNGSNLQLFTGETTLKARLHGVTFLVMDNFSAAEQAASVSEAVADRKFPYVYIRTADTVKDYTLDTFGRLESITFREKDEEVLDQHGQKKSEERYRRWSATSVDYLKPTSTGDGLEVITTTPVTIGMIPVVPIYSIVRPDLSKLLVDPPLFDLGRLNATIFNLDAEIRWLERQQAFSFLYIPGDDPGDLTISESNVLFVPKDSPFTPGFASPPMDIHNGLIAAMDKLVEHFYRLAEQQGVVGVMRQVSGVSKEWDFRALESILKMSSTLATAIEQSIVKLWNAYTGDSVELVSNYPWDFGPISVQDELTSYDSAKDVKSDVFKKEIEIKQARLLLGDIEEDDFQAVLDDIEKVYTEEPAAPPPVPPTMGVTGMMQAPSTEEPEEEVTDTDIATILED